MSKPTDPNNPDLSPLEHEMIQGLRDFSDALESGEPLAERFKTSYVHRVCGWRGRELTVDGRCPKCGEEFPGIGGKSTT